MKELVRKLDNDRRIYNCVIITIQVLFIVLCWKYNVLRLEANDDYWMNTFLNGAYGKYYFYDFFSNILFSAPISLLYKLFPVCNWLFVIYLAVCNLGYFVFSDILWDVFERKYRSVLVFCFLYFATSRYTWLMLTFTRTAGFICAISIIYFIHSVKQENRYKQIIADILFIVGFLIRKEAALLLLPFFICIYLFEIKGKEKKQIIVIMIIMLMTNAINHLYYSQIPLENTVERQNYASMILDYEHLTSEELSSIDFEQENGLNILSYVLKWTYSDYKNISNDFLQDSVEKINNIRIHNRITHIIEKTTNSLHKFCSHNLFFIGIVLLILSMLITNSFKKRYCIIGLLTLFIDCFMSINGRAVDRVIVIPMYMMVLFYIYVICVGFEKDDRKQILTGSFIVLAVWGLINGTYFSSYSLEKICYEDEITNFKEKVDNNGFFVFSVPPNKVEGYSLDLGCPKFGVYENVVIDNGWPAIAPNMMTTIKRRSDCYENLYEVLINDNNAYYCGNDVILVQQYIKDFYNLELDYALVYSEGETNAYTFSRNK